MLTAYVVKLDDLFLELLLKKITLKSFWRHGFIRFLYKVTYSVALKSDLFKIIILA